MLKQDQVLDHYCLEDKYSGLSQIPGKSELDLHYENGTDDFRFEMKMHLNASHTIPETQNAGEVFNDLQRLQSMPAGRKFFLYVTDEVMNRYYGGDAGGRKSSVVYERALKKVFMLSAGGRTIFSLSEHDAPAGFWKKANDTIKTSGQSILVGLGLLYFSQLYCQAANDASSPDGTLYVRLFEVIK